MNCVNHPDAPVEAFCQQCGKALCSQCVRSVAGLVLCEPCLAARLGVPPAGNPVGGSYSVNFGDKNFRYSEAGPMPTSTPYGGDAKPAVAALLGMIPGVGAMYNGQFIKALVHVLVFVVLISLANGNGIFGIFIGAWFFYQVFDAYQTAKARRDGLPLPDPFGLNDLGAKMGLHPAQASAVPPQAPGGVNPGYPPAASTQAAYEAASYQAVAYPEPPVPPMPPIPPIPPRRSEPVGAIILIGLGLMFLLSSMGIFNFSWIHHSWPIFLIAVGGWLIFRRTQDRPNGGSK